RVLRSAIERGTVVRGVPLMMLIAAFGSGGEPCGRRRPGQVPKFKQRPIAENPKDSPAIGARWEISRGRAASVGNVFDACRNAQIMLDETVELSYEQVTYHKVAYLMPDDEPIDQLLPTLGFLMHDVARMHRKRFEQRARAAQFDLTRAHYSVLAHLARH